MQYIHLTEDETGLSHFADAEIPLAEGDFAPPAPPMMISAAESCTRVLYLTLPPGWGGAKHPSPCRQIGHCLSGRMRVTAGDGSVREVTPGGIWRMEDIRGSGHRSEVVGDAPCQLVIVQLE